MFTDRETNGERERLATAHRHELWIQQRVKTNHVSFEYLRLEPRQVIHSDLVLLARDCDENVLTFENFKLLEPSSGYHWIDYSKDDILTHTYMLTTTLTYLSLPLLQSTIDITSSHL